MRASLLAVALLAAAAAPALAQNGLLPPPQPERITLSNGRTWERVRLQHIDVRVLTALTGSPNLATEYDIYRMRYGGGMPMGGGYAGYGYGMGGYGAHGFGGGTGMPGSPGMAGGGPFGGRVILGDPGSNSLLVGPSGLGRGGFAGRGGAGAGGNSPLFPGLIILGDPNTNSLIVDP
jgi:hypothetical protein